MTGGSVVSPPSDTTPLADEAAMQQAMQTVSAMSDLLMPAAIRAGATHRVFSDLSEGSPLDKIARQRGLDREVLGLLVEFYIEVGLVEHDERGYALTALGSVMPSGEPYLSMKGMFGLTARSLTGLDHTLLTGEISTRGVFGTDFWSALSGDESAGIDITNDFMNGAAEHDSDAILDSVDWSGVSTIVDLGGARGDVLLKLLAHLPGVQGVVFEYEKMYDVAVAHLAASPFADRTRAHRGSFFDGIDVDADVYLLSGILADWSDRDSIAILEQARTAAEDTGGRVIVAEIALRGNSARENLFNRAMVTRPVREPDELAELARAAGFRGIELCAETPARSVLELLP